MTQRKHPDHGSLYGRSTRDTAPVAVSRLFDVVIHTFLPRFALGPGGIPASAWGQASAPISRPTLCEQWWLLNVNVSSARSRCGGAVGTRRRGRLERCAPRPARGTRRGRHLTRGPCSCSGACCCSAKPAGPSAPAGSSSYWVQSARWSSDRIARPRTLRHARSVAAGQRAAHRALAFNCATFCPISAAQSAIAAARLT